jgi:ABC-type polysaccharide/polyol phosphate transport system, ATPase component
MATAIEFNHVGKQYRLGLVSTKTLSHDLNRWWQMNVLKKEDPYLKIGEVNDRSTIGGSEYVWALKDIDFKVEQGDVVGIIGKNGAGKSTLLKLLSKVTGPTVGTIRAHGRIGALLEVGTGFHPEMTGRENIYMNGAIMGMTKKEISSKLDEIVAFSGCERYIDTPVKRYSSGMMVRLGFAVAAHLDPEILVVDEVLAVGDAEFQNKAIDKMQAISRGEGRTVLFVSHNMASMLRLCKHGIVLDKGLVHFDGSMPEAISNYLGHRIVQSEYHGDYSAGEKLNLLFASVQPAEGSVFYCDTPIDITVRFAVNEEISFLVCGFNIYSSFMYPLARADFNDVNGQTSLPKGEYLLRYRIPAGRLSNGEYTVVFDLAERGIRNYASDNSTLSFTVEISKNSSINIYNELMPQKSSIMRENWLVSCEKV